MKKDDLGKQSMKKTAQLLIGRHRLHCRPVMESQPWYRKLRTHRGELGV